MNVVDSSGWLEFFTDGPNASFFAPAIEDQKRLLIPSISLFEVFKRLHLQGGAEVALQAMMSMHGGKVVDLDGPLAQRAALLSLRLRLPMADSVILATAQAYRAKLWTQDADFEGMDGVEYTPRRP
ncbi:MAG: type II toxin-antitoxin system VapC family toxin [Acidobacteria bacterium]|nr:type II toxin-antitoxin system VapC family toxin [Acidobacteriota bacterium]